jgi:hypothetical protein
MAEQAISFYSGVLLSLNIEKVRMFVITQKKWFVFFIAAVLFTAGFVLAVKQLHYVRIFEGENIGFHTINLINKYGFALFILLVCIVFLKQYNFMPQRLKNVNGGG